MAYGMVVKNDNGAILWDTQNPCLSFIEKGTLSGWTVDTWATSNRIKYTTFTYVGITDSAPVVAINFPTNVVGGIIKTALSGNTFTFTVVVAGTGVPSLGTVTYYVFDRPRDVTTGWGIKVKNPTTGLVTFLSTSKLMQAKTFLIGNSNTSFGNSQTYGIACPIGYTIVDEGPILGPANYVSYIQAGGISTGGGYMTALSGANTPTATGAAPTSSVFNGGSFGGAGGLLVDVTGL